MLATPRMADLLTKQLLLRALARDLVTPDQATEVERRVKEGAPLEEALQALGAPADVLDAITDRALIGRQLGRFRLDAILGAGGMGTVFRARQSGLDRDVAVKVVDARVVKDPTELERFRREAKAACRLDHPNVIQPIDFGEDGTLLYFAMELAPGGTAEARIAKRGRYDEGDALETLEAIAEALAYASTLGIVHRDVKPANIFYSASRTPKLGDLGIVLDAGATRVTGEFAAVGTVLYMPPEQATARPLDARADVYALGISVVEMLTGKPPFLGDNPLAVVAQHLKAPPPDLAILRPGISAGTAELVRRMTAKAPSDRPLPAEVARRAGELRTGVSTVKMTAPVMPTAPPSRSSGAMPSVASRPGTSGESGGARMLATPVPSRPLAALGRGPAAKPSRSLFFVLAIPLLLAASGVITAIVLSRRPPTIHADVEDRAVEALRQELLSRRYRSGGFGETTGEPADPWVTGEALEALVLLEDAGLRRSLGADIEKLSTLALTRTAAAAEERFDGFPYAVGDTAPCMEATCAVGRAVALSIGRVEGDPLPLARSLLAFLLRSQAPSGAFATIPALGDDGAMTSATVDGLAALAALATALGEERRALPAVERAADWLAAIYDGEEGFFPVNPRRPTGAGRRVRGLDEAAALALLDARDLAMHLGVAERPNVGRVLRAFADHPARSGLEPDEIDTALVEDYRFQRFLPPTLRTTATEFAWIPASWRLVLAARLAREPDAPRREEWADESLRLRARVSRLPERLHDVPATWKVSEAFMGITHLRAAERAGASPGLVPMVRAKARR